VSDFRRMPRSALVGPSASARIPEHWLTGGGPRRWSEIDHVPLAQFVLLSMLLHALAIALFGAPSGGSREGRAMWGSLQVLLLPGRQIEEAPSAPPALPRIVLPKPKPAPVAKPAAPVLPKVPEEIPKPPQETLPVEAAPTAAPLSFPPLLDRIKTPESTLEAPALKVPVPLETPIAIPAPMEKVEVRERAPEMAPAVELPPMREAPVVPAPVPLPAPQPAPAPPQPPVEAAPAPPPVMPIPAPAPVFVPAPAPTPAPEPPPVERAPIEAPAVPALPASTPPVAQPPIEVPPIPVATPANLAPPTIEPPPMPVEKPRPAEAPAVPAAPPIERLEPPAPIREVPVKRESELPKVDVAPRLAAPLPGPSESPFRSAPKTAPGAQQDYDPTAPALDIDAVRKRAGAIAREGSGQRAILPFPMPLKPEHKTKTQIAIENARKPDCRNAYASLGLAAIIPLIANEFGEGTCRW
jgi:hypothetical protein